MILLHYNNYDDNLILSYEDETIIDGVWDGIVVIKLEFEGKDLIKLKKLYI